MKKAKLQRRGKQKEQEGGMEKKISHHSHAIIFLFHEGSEREKERKE